MRYGVWYDDGRMDFGWLAEEHNHGRQYRAEYLTLEEAQKVAERQSYYDPETVWVAEPIDGDDEERFKRVRQIAGKLRVKRLESELARAKKESF
jgi:hypothetical protein